MKIFGIILNCIGLLAFYIMELLFIGLLIKSANNVPNYIQYILYIGAGIIFHYISKWIWKQDNIIKTKKHINT